MASDIGTHVSLKTVVAMALDEVDKSIADFDKCWILALRGLVKLNFSISGEPETVCVPVLANKTVPFPAGMLQWSKIGIMDAEGKINTLKINNSLTTYRDVNPNRLSDLTPQVNTSIGQLTAAAYYSNYYYQGGCYQLFGVGGGLITYGECRADEVNKVFVLNPDFQYDSVLIEGIMIPEKNNDYQIYTCMQEALISFIKWKLKLAPAQEFYDAAIEGRRSLPRKRAHLQVINEVIREATGMYLKA